MQNIPLFPLHTVLYPDGQLPLRIFEPRYVDMISECLKTNTGFGVCLIKQGAETGPAATCFNIGTYAEVVDFSRQTNGLLTITIQGKKALEGFADGCSEQQFAHGGYRLDCLERNRGRYGRISVAQGSVPAYRREL